MDVSECCPYKRECATIIYWSETSKNYIRNVCDTDEHTKCLHFSGSLRPQHDERKRLFGCPHHGEPNWDEVARNK